MRTRNFFLVAAALFVISGVTSGMGPVESGPFQITLLVLFALSAFLSSGIVTDIGSGPRLALAIGTFVVASVAVCSVWAVVELLGGLNLDSNCFLRTMGLPGYRYFTALLIQLLSIFELRRERRLQDSRWEENTADDS